MFYDSVLTYVRKVLKNDHIPSSILTEPYENLEMLDLGLRESLFRDFDKTEAFRIFTEHCAENTLYYCTDSYYCSYVVMLLPNPSRKEYFFVGPFTYVEINQKSFLSLTEELKVPSSLLPVLENYYYNLAFVGSENHFKNLMITLADTIWPEAPGYSVEMIEGNPWSVPHAQEFVTDVEQSYLLPMNIKALEERYDFENRCVQAVVQGNVSVIDQLSSYGNTIRFIPRQNNSLRDYKNYMIIINTILRKAAEQSAVHPVYLDRVSGKFAKKIEALTVIPDHTLEKEMLHKYCLLVRNYSLKGYSPIIQKVLNHINLNLTGDLSLKTLAVTFNISAGYLSTLFKKETGSTLTDYVNKQRIEYSILLLNATDLQIQTIASYCGIYDINYFTRIFKKFKGMTPKKYRELIQSR
ncbi:MAG: helix-turn-helix domain-containing protein [Eubacteriales bacterium]|nr:helix-turn-helix domain-containing protein [Eubacteriales bacterium]